MNAIVKFQAPRLPYHPAIKERFGVDASGWKALVEAVFPSAKSHDAVVMALSYCKARKLDPFKKPVHIVPMWDSKSGGYVETVWPGISEVRTTAFRTGQYVGCDEAEFGPTSERTFTGRVKVKGNWEDKTITVSFPEWCRMTVYREMGGRSCKFVGPKVKWIESYATVGNSDLPNDMWESRPEGQIEKCAEAAALRKAFPEEIGNELTAEEMEGRRIRSEGPSTPPPSPPAPPPPPPPIEDATFTETAAAVPPPTASAQDAGALPSNPAESAPAPAEDAEGIDPEAVLANLAEQLAVCEDAACIEDGYTYLDVETDLEGFDGFVEKARALKAEHLARVAKMAPSGDPESSPSEEAAPPPPPADEAPPAAEPDTSTPEAYEAVLVAKLDAANDVDAYEVVRAWWGQTRAHRQDVLGIKDHGDIARLQGHFGARKEALGI